MLAVLVDLLVAPVGCPSLLGGLSVLIPMVGSVLIAKIPDSCTGRWRVISRRVFIQIPCTVGVLPLSTALISPLIMVENRASP